MEVNGQGEKNGLMKGDWKCTNFWLPVMVRGDIRLMLVLAEELDITDLLDSPVPKNLVAIRSRRCLAI